MATAITNVVFHPLSSRQGVCEMGGSLKGHVKLTVSSLVKGVTIKANIRGRWTVAWRDSLGRPEEANRRVCSLDHDVLSNVTFFKGDHGLPLNFPIPANMPCPPSIAPKKESYSIKGECAFVLQITVSCPSGSLLGSLSVKHYDFPITILPSSAQRARVLANQSPIALSNIWTEIAPGTSCPTPPAIALSHMFSAPSTEFKSPASAATAIYSPFGGPLGGWDPLHFAPPSIPIDHGDIRFELQLPRRSYLFGDTIPIRIVMKPRLTPLGIEKSISAAVVSIIGVQSFRMPRSVSASGPRSRRNMSVIVTKKFDFSALAEDSTVPRERANSAKSNIGDISSSETVTSSTIKDYEKLSIRQSHAFGSTSSFASDGSSNVPAVTRILKMPISTSISSSADDQQPMASMGGNGVIEVRHILRVAVFVTGGPTTSSASGLVLGSLNGSHNWPNTLPNGPNSSKPVDPIAAKVASAAITNIIRSKEIAVMGVEPSLVVEIPIALVLKGAGFNLEAVPYVPRSYSKSTNADPESGGPNEMDLTYTETKRLDDESEWEVKGPHSLSQKSENASQQLESSTDIDAELEELSGMVMEEGEMEEDDPARLDVSNMPVSGSFASLNDMWDSNGDTQQDEEEETRSSEALTSMQFVAIYLFITDDPSEVCLSVGDKVTVTTTYADGWCFATNETTSMSGFCPLHHLCIDNSQSGGSVSMSDAISTSISQKIEPTSDWRRLCHHEPRFRNLYTLMTGHKPDVGEIILPPTAHISGTLKRTSSAWADQERCQYCFNQGAPNAWRAA